jgi:rubrerythrin
VVKRSFKSLSALELLALAISLEEEDSRLLGQMGVFVRKKSPSFAKKIEKLRKEEDSHRKRLTTLYRKQYGEHIPLIRPAEISGFVERIDYRKLEEMTPDKIMEVIALMELETQRFYEKAATTTQHTAIRKLFSDLAEEEREHESSAHSGKDELAESGTDRTKRQLFILQVIQPSLVGLMDGSISTLAPLFAAAYATKNTWETFLIGVAAALGAAISMGFAEGLSDDGSLTGRGKPLIRGAVTGGMTFLGGILHTLPFLLADFKLATMLSFGVVVVELISIAWIRNRYMETPIFRSIVQVIIGGLLVFLAGYFIGHG